MLDTGSDRDVISEELLMDLELTQRRRPVTIQTVEASTIDYRHFVYFRIQSMHGSYNALVGKLVAGKTDIPPAKRNLAALCHVENIELDIIDAGIFMIIGISHPEAWTGVEVRRGSPRQPIAMKTNFGWTLVGRWASSNTLNIAYQSTIIDNAVLHKDLERIFYHDFATVSEEEIGQSRENKNAIAQLQNSIRFDTEKKKYVIGLPWKHSRDLAKETLNALDSRRMALNCLTGMIPHFWRDEERKQRVFKEMAKFFEKGYAVPINEEEENKKNNPRWYLPLLVVEKGLKTRICHDACAAVKGTCLNDLLLGGPNLINSMSFILLAFREKKIAFMMDIASFFHRVLNNENDANVFRFLWFKDESMSEFIVYRFLAHIFGSGASSVVTSFVLRHCNCFARDPEEATRYALELDCKLF